MTAASHVLELVRSRVGQPYVLGVSVNLADPAWGTRAGQAWDCAELVSWGAYQATGQLVGCIDDRVPVAQAEPYSGGWAQFARTNPELALPPAVAAATVGAVLIRAPSTFGGTGHVALSAGAGRTVEAYDSRRGVIESVSLRRRWTHAVRIPGVSYLLEAPVDLAAPAIVLRPFDRGPAVLRVQVALRREGIDPGELDGIFGPSTAAAVEKFQRSHHLVPDGEVGPITAAALGVAL